MDIMGFLVDISRVRRLLLAEDGKTYAMTHVQSIRPNGEELRRLRRQKGWSQANLAAKTGVEKKTISRIEGSQPCFITTLGAIADVFGRSVQSLVHPSVAEFNVAAPYGTAILPGPIGMAPFLPLDLVAPLVNADTHQLQILVSRGANLQQNTRGGSTLHISFDLDTPTIRHREAKARLPRAIPDFLNKCIERQCRIDGVLSGADPGPIPVGDDHFPFRFANGGALPILEMNQRQYYCLFYRDVEPVGWNIANGGSDSRRELTNPVEIIDREFREELLLVHRGRQTRFFFCAKNCDSAETAESTQQWTRWHSVLRGHDAWEGSDIRHFTPQRLVVEWVGGPDTLEIFLPDGKTVKLGDLYLNINAADCSIEVDRVAMVRVPDESRLLDGECYDDDILNRPIGLFEVGRFKDQQFLTQTEFKPDLLFHFGQLDSNPVLSVCDEFVERLVRKRLVTPDHLSAWRNRHQRLNLCPVTRGIIGRLVGGHASIGDGPRTARARRSFKRRGPAEHLRRG